MKTKNQGFGEGERGVQNPNNSTRVTPRTPTLNRQPWCVSPELFTVEVSQPLI